MTINIITIDLARKLEKIAAEKGVQLFLASDVIVADKFAPDANNKVNIYIYIYSYTHILRVHVPTYIETYIMYTYIMFTYIYIIRCHRS
jgi:hypothetical protein